MKRFLCCYRFSGFLALMFLRSLMLVGAVTASFWNKNYSLDVFDELRAQGIIYAENNTDSGIGYSSGGTNQTSYRIAHLGVFLPLSFNGLVRTGIFDDIASILVGVHHFNYKDQSPVFQRLGMDDCDIRFTAELFDSQMDPVATTSTFLERIAVNDEDPLTAVVGAYRSAVTSPLAILTAVYEIPQISASSVASDFDNVGQYPYFARTCSSTAGEAQVAVSWFKTMQDRLGKTVDYIGMLYVRDVYGDSIQKSFVEEAIVAEIEVVSVPFAYLVEDEGEIIEAVRAMKKTQFRYMYVSCYAVHVIPILTAAMEEGMTGDDFFWLFTGPDVADFQSIAKLEPNDFGYRLKAAISGIGFIALQDRPYAGALFPAEEAEEEDLSDPRTAGQMIAAARKEAVKDPTFVEHVIAKTPASIKNLTGYSPVPQFSRQPKPDGSFLYDAVTAFGVAMCRANETFFTAEHVAPLVKTSSFEGATGELQLDHVTGTRDPRSLTYVLWNARPRDDVKTDLIDFRIIPTNYYTQQGWQDYEQTTFIYADGTAIPPDDLPPVTQTSSVIGTASFAIGAALVIIAILCNVYCINWTMKHKAEPCVCASQLSFLLLVSSGTLLVSFSGLALLLTEIAWSGESSDVSCMAFPWLFHIGLSMAICPICVKLWKLREILIKPELEVVRLDERDFAAGLLMVESFVFVILVTWTWANPFVWTLTEGGDTDVFGRASTYYLCSSSNSETNVYAVLLPCFQGLILLLACRWSYETRDLETEYNETQYIGYATLLLVELMIVGYPLIFVMESSPSSRFFFFLAVVLLVCCVLLGFVFVPKMNAQATEQRRGYEMSFRCSTANALDGSNLKPMLANETSVPEPPKTRGHSLPTDGQGLKGLRVTRHPKVSTDTMKSENRFYHARSDPLKYGG